MADSRYTGVEGEHLDELKYREVDPRLSVIADRLGNLMLSLADASNIWHFLEQSGAP